MRALVTFATEEMAELQRIALPSLRAFGERHGYELLVTDGKPNRPASWFKIPALLRALQTHEEALWIDADVVIVDGSEDLPVPVDAWQALVVHNTQDGEVPNHGVWLCRRPMVPVLRRIWSMRAYINHPWWEQGASLELLGYDSWARPTIFHGPTELYEHTHFLGTEWNSHPWDEAEHPRFRHASMTPDRAAAMREWMKEADLVAAK